VAGLVTAAPASATSDVSGGSFASPVALPVPVPGSFVATNAGISSAGSYNASTGPFWNNTTWFSYTPAQSERVSIRATSINPSGWDNTLEVWTAGGTLITQRDDAYGLDALVVADLTAGTQYRIGLGGFRPAFSGSVTLALGNQVPDAPSGVSAATGSGSATVSWSAPADHGSPVTAYTVQCAQDGGSWSACRTVTGTPPLTSATVSGLTNGSGYRFRVVATSNIGDSAASAPAPDTATPQLVPRATSATTATAPASVARHADATVTAHVVSGGQPVSGGTVTVAEGGTVLGTAAVTAGAADLDVDLPVGAHTLTVSFGGTAAVAPSSGTVPLTVVKAAQTITFDEPAAVSTGSAVPLSATASSRLPVSFSATGGCRVDGLQLVGVSLGTCTVTAVQAGSADHEPAPDVTVTLPVIEPVGLALQLDSPLSARAAGAPVTARGEGLLPGSSVTLELHSTPRTLTTGVVGADGTVALTGLLPMDIESGAHELVLLGTAADGSAARTVLALRVSATGELTRIGDAFVPQVLAVQASAPALAFTGAPVLPLVGWGSGLVLVGGGVLFAGRRRSTASR
jgi:hypothetical protein